MSSRKWPFDNRGRARTGGDDLVWLAWFLAPLVLLAATIGFANLAKALELAHKTF